MDYENDYEEDDYDDDYDYSDDELAENERLADTEQADVQAEALIQRLTRTEQQVQKMMRQIVVMSSNGK